MKVKQLKELLNKFDDDVTVVMDFELDEDGDECFYSIDEVKAHTMSVNSLPLFHGQLVEKEPGEIICALVRHP